MCFLLHCIFHEIELSACNGKTVAYLNDSFQEPSTIHQTKEDVIDITSVEHSIKEVKRVEINDLEFE